MDRTQDEGREALCMHSFIHSSNHLFTQSSIH